MTVRSTALQCACGATAAFLETASGSAEVILDTLRFLPAFAMLSVAPAAAQDVPPPIPVFPAAVENVNVDVFVSRGGRRVEGLKASDFLLTDQGVVQNVEIVAGQQAAIDVVLALDISGSVAGLRLRSLRKGAHQFVDRLLPIDSLTVLVFSSDLLLPVRAGASRAEAHAAIDRFAGEARRR